MKGGSCRSTWIATGLLTLACGTDPTSFRVGCNQIDAVTIGQGITPQISWEPDCPVAAVAVYEATPGTPPEDPVPPLPGQGSTAVPHTKVWEVAAAAEAGNRLSPGVRYGRVPDDASELTPAQLLRVGQLYLVILTVQRPDDPSFPYTAREDFTP
jgi:hypothetical protein